MTAARRHARADRARRGTLIAIEQGLYRYDDAADRWLVAMGFAEVIPAVISAFPSAPVLEQVRLTRKGRAELSRLGAEARRS